MADVRSMEISNTAAGIVLDGNGDYLNHLEDVTFLGFEPLALNENLVAKPDVVSCAAL